LKPLTFNHLRRTDLQLNNGELFIPIRWEMKHTRRREKLIRIPDSGLENYSISDQDFQRKELWLLTKNK